MQFLLLLLLLQAAATSTALNTPTPTSIPPPASAATTTATTTTTSSTRRVTKKKTTANSYCYTYSCCYYSQCALQYSARSTIFRVLCPFIPARDRCKANSTANPESPIRVRGAAQPSPDALRYTCRRLGPKAPREASGRLRARTAARRCPAAGPRVDCSVNYAEVRRLLRHLHVSLG